jgi:tripartite-type tricarboxylate transporter receptor subunit TctC
LSVRETGQIDRRTWRFFRCRNTVAGMMAMRSRFGFPVHDSRAWWRPERRAGRRAAALAASALLISLPQIESATIKPLAVLTRERSPILPDLASAYEQGLSDFEATIWYAFFLPKGTPAAIVRKLHDAAVATMETPSVRERLKDIGATVVAPERRSPDYLQGFVEREIAKWAVPIKAANITGE